MKSVKGLAAVVLIVGGATASFLAFVLALSLTFSLFSRPPVLDLVLGYASLAGPLPLVAGAILLFFQRTQKLGTKLTLAGCFIMSTYMVICYTRLGLYFEGIWDRLFWFGLIPIAVLAADYSSYRVYLLIKPGPNAAAAVHAGGRHS